MSAKRKIKITDPPSPGKTPPTLDGRALTARPDPVDFRDQMYIATLVEVPQVRPLEEYLATGPTVLDQGQEGACTGFGLAAVANHLLKVRRVSPDAAPVSPRMLYEMARRNDEWPGEDYSGSSARGAMKGWNKFGVCSETEWPYLADRNLTKERMEDALVRPLGAYFRVNHQDIVAMHSAIAEAGILYATSSVHNGWMNVKSDGIIHHQPDVVGGHAFAIVGYDHEGLWIQNSWGSKWGKSGFGHVGYSDWLENGSDVWVARLGAPVKIDSAVAYGSSTFPGVQMSQAASIASLRPHIVNLGKNGVPMENGDFSNTPDEIRGYVSKDFARITAGWKKKRIVLYAHGGLVGAEGAIQRIAEYREVMLKQEVYPLAFIWNSDFWSVLKDILSDGVRSLKPEGFLDRTKDFMLDRLDNTLEPIARFGGGKAEWSEMKENALGATTSALGGARLVIAELKKLVAKDPSIEIHVAGHSAGSIFLGPLVQEIAKFARIATCQLWAPACSVDLFRQYYLPLLKGQGRAIRELALYTLTDKAEQDDNCANIYHKSLLYLVSRAFEDEYSPFKWGWPGAPVLGMEKFIRSIPEISDLFSNRSASWILSPNNSSDPLLAARSASHGGFDDDPDTLKGTLARILGVTSTTAAFDFSISSSRTKDRRQALSEI